MNLASNIISAITGIPYLNPKDIMFTVKVLLSFPELTIFLISAAICALLRFDVSIILSAWLLISSRRFRSLLMPLITGSP